MKKEIKFIFTFLVISGLLYILVSIYYSENLPVIGASNVASTLSKVLELMGIKTRFVSHTVYLPNNIELRVILECTGAYEMIILSSIILSYPAGIKKKIYGIISGIITIYILNILRLITISYVLVYYIEKFDFIDRYLWQVSLVIFISLAYSIWLRSIGRSGSLS